MTRIGTLILLIIGLFLISGPSARGQEAEELPPLDQAMLELEAGRLDQAIALLEPYLDEPVPPPPILAVLGALYLEAGRPAGALELLGPMAEKENADPAVLYNAGRAALALGQMARGEDYLERSVALAPGSPSSRELGLLRGQQGRYSEAFMMLLPWARANPEDEEARLAGALCAVQLDRLPPAEELLADLPRDKPQVRFLWGRIQLLQGDPLAAIITLEPLLKGHSTGSELDVRRTLAGAYMMAGRSVDAVEVLKGRVENHPAAAVELADAYYLSGDLEAALATIASPATALMNNSRLGRVPADTSLGARMLRQYGQLLIAFERYEEALPALEQATGYEPNDKQAWQGLGQALAAVGRVEEASVALERFREINAKEKMPLAPELEEEARDPAGREIRRGLDLILAGQPGQALDIAHQEATLAPDDSRPVLLAARALLELNRPEEALAAVESVLAGVPGNPDAHYLRGVIRMTVNDLSGAESDLRRVLELSPNHTAAMNDLAILLMTKGEKEGARQLLERVLELQPDDPTAKANLSRLQEP